MGVTDGLQVGVKVTGSADGVDVLGTVVGNSVGFIVGFCVVGPNVEGLNEGDILGSELCANEGGTVYDGSNVCK